MYSMEIEVERCIQGHHMYSTIWTSVLGKLLSCKTELDNAEDQYAIAVCKVEGIVVGHILRKISFLHAVLIRRGGIIQCMVNEDH